jgi:hypothetical protein
MLDEEGVERAGPVEYRLSLANAAAASSSAGIIIGTDFESGLCDEEPEVILSM